jgi:hypothetical protein
LADPGPRTYAEHLADRRPPPARELPRGCLLTAIALLTAAALLLVEILHLWGRL